MTDEQYPKIHAYRTLFQGRIFRIEDLDLEFKNGEKRTFQRCCPRSNHAVLVIPLVDANTLLLIREYAAGLERYELGFPKGLAEPHEDPCIAANREMMEEVGFGAKKLTYLKEMTAIPGYFTNRMHCVIAEDLYPQQLSGDEPEPLEVVPWSLDNIDALLARDDFTEGRCIAALLMVRDYLKRQK